MFEVLVVGAGIAVLTAAYRLRQGGHEVTVLEAGDHVGGRMRTEERDGYAMDTGAYLLSTKYDRMRALIEEIGFSDAVQTGANLFGIVRDRRVHRLGGSLFDGARSSALSWSAKLATARMVLDAKRLGSRLDWFELSRASSADVESAAAYALRRGGRELLDYVVDPVMRISFMDSSERISAVDLLFAMNNFYGAGLFNLRDGIGSRRARPAGGCSAGPTGHRSQRRGRWSHRLAGGRRRDPRKCLRDRARRPGDGVNSPRASAGAS
jgi:oxygen-dependent protoporphyrinogen oxidase